MKAIIEVATGRAFYLFPDNEVVTLTENGVSTPFVIGDMRLPTHEVVTIDAPAKWVDGGVMGIVDGAWVINDQTAYDAFEVPVEPVTCKIVTPTRYLAIVKAVSQMTNAEFAAYANDASDDMVYVRAMLASISGMIDINIDDNMALVVEGLDLMAAHSHTGQIAPAAFTATILGYWATL